MDKFALIVGRVVIGLATLSVCQRAAEGFAGSVKSIYKSCKKQK